MQIILGSNGKKPRYDAVLTVTTTDVGDAQKHIEAALDKVTKRWRFDEVVTNIGKPSELYYLVRRRKAVSRDAMLTAIRTGGNGSISHADIEIGDAVAKEAGELRDERKKAEHPT